MQVALPVAVKFLCKNNGELSRNLASYLSLAAIEYSYLLSPHVQLILDSLLAGESGYAIPIKIGASLSLLSGNYGLCRVLSQIYEISPEPINVAAPSIIEIIPRCDLQEKLVLLQLLAMVAKSKSHTVLHNSLPQLCDLLNQPVVAPAAMNVLLKMAENRPLLLIDHADIIKNAATTPQTVPHAAQILSIIGRSSKERAQIALDFVLEHLPEADRAAQTILLQQATTLCSQYPILFTDKVTSVIRQKNTQKSNSQIDGAVSTGTVTIVKLNHTSLPTTTVTPLTHTKSQVAVINENAAVSTTVTVNGASTSSSTKLLPLVLPTTSNNSYLPPPTYNQSFLVQNNYNSLMTLISPNTFNVPHTAATGSLMGPGPAIPVPVPPTPPHTG
jgi:protein melted